MAGLLTPDPVAAELRRWAAEPFDLASANCGLALLDYAERATGNAVRRGRGITGRRSAIRLMRRPEELLAVCVAIMRRLGCPEIETPTRGDVGLVDLPAGLTACLCLGGADAGMAMWAARGDQAAMIQPAAALAAWSVPCPRP